MDKPREGKSAGTERSRRLAQALKDNIRRRKEQARAREEQPGEPAGEESEKEVP